MFKAIQVKRGWVVQNVNTYVIAHTCKTEAEAVAVADKLNRKD